MRHRRQPRRIIDVVSSSASEDTHDLAVLQTDDVDEYSEDIALGDELLARWLKCMDPLRRSELELAEMDANEGDKYLGLCWWFMLC
ncbi:unnamed protein product [Trifolium pratense]|uniref:Uncharacterized protein n=2 Tax=Trifolium pratense TaxID=57577 RepID=A0ACB0KVH4_TRIPR|nr:unnamed protein product [Trifolium pratense]